MLAGTALKPAPKATTERGAEQLRPEKQCPKPLGNMGEPLSPAEQRRRFGELSRELGTENDETLDWVFGKIVPAEAPTEEAQDD
ncbi:hypothetical protein GOFOIKOB_1439 [Methylobacterium tardum]|uniref:Uncharacterized protein n=2 Tax=Methylobacterium tardum TaxID=374432 RepID=A0AA37TPM3_9HYPH|nr:hypothetical protein GOFOIKOB_1439 [Methylobacterium tardum]GLS73021.1 hypothetical protein GCM10007890_50360 [Methylobacterium tardum]